MTWHRAVAVSLLGMLALPSRALSHDGVQRSVPAKDSHLSVAPRSLRLTFGSAPNLAFVRVQLVGPNDGTVVLGPLTLDSVRTVVTDVIGPLSAGAYTVRWQVTGADGHPVRGEFKFMIAPGAAGLGVVHAGHGETRDSVADDAPAAHHDPATMPTGPGFDAQSPGYVVIRWATFTSVLALVGALAFLFVVMPLVHKRTPSARAESLASRAAPRAASLGMFAALSLIVAAVARLAAQSYAMHGASDAASMPLISGMLTQTVWGWGWLAQGVAAVTALIAFTRARRGAHGAWPAAASAGALVAFTLPLSGHALAVDRWVPLAIAADGLHVIGAAGWLGGLLALLVVGMPSAMSLGSADRGPAVADLVNAFSPAALIFAGLAAMTGVFAAWLHLGGLAALWSSQYGQALLWKLGLLALVAATGAYNWQRVRPALGSTEAAALLRKSATVEIAIGLLVIAVTAVLVATPPPLDAAAINQ